MRDLCDLLRRDDLAAKSDAFELIEPVDQRMSHGDEVWLAERGMHVYQVLICQHDIDYDGDPAYEYVPLSFAPIQQKA